MGTVVSSTPNLPVFDRNFWDGAFRFTRMGSGSLGGKAAGLVQMHELLTQHLDVSAFPGVEIDVPTMAVISSDYFGQFIAQNRLTGLPVHELSDDRIAHAFEKGDLPVELVGDLRALIAQVHTPLAIRSSSLLEDALAHPFAGVYETKMIPNNQPDADTRFRRLVEAIKFVYASTWFKSARDYIRTTGQDPAQERMAVIIQEVVGLRRDDRFYPDIAGVARSFNFYARPPARPEDGVVSLALGLGKTIVDGGLVWTYSPAYPKKPPPFGSVGELLRESQTEFWAVNMGKPPAYDPVSEVEYLVHTDLADAERDGVLGWVASTYDPERDRIVPGIGARGPRVLDFAPLLVHGEELPLNELVKALLHAAEKVSGQKVEIEFAITIEERRGTGPRIRVGFLQARVIAVADDIVEIADHDMAGAVVSSNMALGNGTVSGICDIVFVRPEKFSPTDTPCIAQELAEINRTLVEQQRPYVLIGLGRWGSSHPSLGIPVDWSQIAGARAIVEATLPQMNVELSQGSHFFHNLSSFRVSYLMVRHDGGSAIDWEWLERQPVVTETKHVRHVRPEAALRIVVDGRTARGVIRQQAAERDRSE